MDHCRHCPVAPESRPCRAVAILHPRVCALADPGHPDHSEAYVRLLRGEPEPCAPPYPPAPGPPAPEAETPPAEAVRADRPAYEPLTRSWLARVNTCPWRECRAGCQSTLCHAGRGDASGRTTLENCRACLRAADPD